MVGDGQMRGKNEQDKLGAPEEVQMKKAQY